MKLLTKSLLLLFVLITRNVCGQPAATYLATHATDLSIGTIKDSKTIGPDFYTNHLFLVGEIHGIKRGQDVDLALLTLLNKKINLTTYIAEVDFAKAYFLNQYLADGDESLIDAVFKDWAEQDAQWANTDFQDKIRKIRRYNMTLKPEQRIHFEGVDQIHNPLLVARYFKEILKDSQFKNSRLAFDPLLVTLEMKNDSLIIQSAAQLIDKLNKDHSVKNDEILFALKNCTQVKISREAVMHSNFKELFRMRNWEKQKLYSFMGFGHILQSKTNNDKSVFLAYRLENDTSLPLKGKIVSIGMIYLDSKMSMPSAGLPAQFQDKGKRFTAFSQYNHDGPLIMLDGIADFKAVTKENSTTLFDLHASGSPYLTKSFVIKYAKIMPKEQRLYFDEKGKFITDYLQYVVLIRNSAETNMLLP